MKNAGLRCPYHGWKYDVSGQCVDLPSEGDSGPMRQRIKLKSYPCIEAGGVIWTYMGPPELKPAPPAFEWVSVAPERRFVSKRLQECNYLQALEGGIDSSHVSFLHSGALKSDPLFVGSKGNVYNERDRMPQFDVVEFEGGLLIGARRNAENNRYYWRITPWILPTAHDHSAARRSSAGRTCVGADRRSKQLGVEHQLSSGARTHG
jgi:phenylpropionate dioxygenase-like ring-hydroxylating dioxygenase large terminal subunit